MGRFICLKCEHSNHAFDGIHTIKHTIARIPGDIESGFSVEERLRLIEAELGRVRQMVGRLVLEDEGKVEGERDFDKGKGEFSEEEFSDYEG